jgi:hypothetical protein
MTTNPYRAGGRSDFLIGRDAVQQLGEAIRSPSNTKGFVLLGGPGSGKSIALMQIEEMIRSDDTVVRRFEDRESTENGCHLRVCRALGATPNPELPNCTDAIERWLEGNPGRRLVLLFDEFGAQLDDRGRAFFNVLESVRKTCAQRVTVVLAGGAQLMRFAMARGSPFWSVATREILPPFGEAEIAALAARFASDLGHALEPDTLDAIRILSGGNAFLVTHVLQRLWEVPLEQRSVSQVADLLDDGAQLGGFKDTFERALNVRHPQHPMRQVWNHLVSRVAPHDFIALEGICRQSEPADLGAENVLLFLQAAGLLRFERSGRSVRCEILPTVLQPSLHELAPAAKTFQDRLHQDVERILLEIHGNGLDYFSRKKELVPESVFSAFICSALRLLGWDAEREVQRAGGRIDVRARHVVYPGQSGVVEVKLWPRNDYKTVGEQAASYYQRGAIAFTTVMITDRKQANGWAEEYERECLRGRYERVQIAPPLAGCFRAVVTTADTAEVTVIHLLLRVPGGRED